MLQIMLSDGNGLNAPEWSKGSPGPGFNQISEQGLRVWYTAMVYNHGIQEVRKQK